MKKRFLLMAMAGVALAGCVSNEVEEIVQEQKGSLIRFDAPVTYTNGSRANYYGEIGAHSYGEGTSAGTYTYPWREYFIVYAKKHQNDFAGWDDTNNANFWTVASESKEFILVKSDDRFNGWSPATVTENDDETLTYSFVDHHWPTGYKLSFAAYSPANLELGDDYDEDNITYTNTGLSIKNFQVQSESKNQYDLLFSERTCNHDGYTSSASSQAGINYYNGVPIKFQHALSSIHFSLKNASSKVVKLKKITLYGVKDKGHFNEGITETSNNYSQYVRKTTINDTNGNVWPTWSFTDENGTAITDNIVNENNAYVAFNGEITFPTQAELVSSILAKKKADGQSSDNEYAYALLLIPQHLTEDGAEVKIKVTYNVDNATTDITKEYTLGTQSGTDVSTNTNVTVNEWTIGTRYTYQLLYSDESVADDLIYFAPQTDEWKDVTPIIITL